ncbi:hypothetical protein Xfasm12_0333 [Xylella fastidiosa M12]|nr:hypothetical protein Xfasm12_0333 [Xylella fastidiosa M12]
MNRTRKKDSTSNELFQPQPQRNVTSPHHRTSLDYPHLHPNQNKWRHGTMPHISKRYPTNSQHIIVAPAANIDTINNHANGHSIKSPLKHSKPMHKHKTP